MGNEELKKVIDDILASKRDSVFSKIDMVTNNIIEQLEELKGLPNFVEYEIPAGFEMPTQAPPEPTEPVVDMLHHYIKKISAAAKQLDLITAFLEGINAFCSRAALFLLREDKLVGWKGKGFSGQDGEIGDEEIKKIFFSLSAATIFRHVLDKRTSYFGAPSSQPDDHLIYSRFGGRVPDQVFTLPFFVKGKPQAVIYTDSFDGQAIGEKEIEMIATVGEMSLDLLPLRQKILAKVKTQEFADDPEEPKKPQPPESPPAEERTAPSIRENDPERLARVIVNDIILYNQKQVEDAFKNGTLYETLQNTILQSRELYLNKFSDLSVFERQLIETLAKGKKEALKGYDFETL
ncbi:MAG: hypothetical protein GY940_45335 [bacterium]|nr:hypothetical protein [bacterium]